MKSILTVLILIVPFGFCKSQKIDSTKILKKILIGTWVETVDSMACTLHFQDSIVTFHWYDTKLPIIQRPANETDYKYTLNKNICFSDTMQKEKFGTKYYLNLIAVTPDNLGYFEQVCYNIMSINLTTLLLYNGDVTMDKPFKKVKDE